MRFTQNFQKHFTNLALRKKIFLFFVILIICSILLSNLILSYLTGKYNREIYALNAQLLDNVISSIESEMQAIEEMSNYIIGNETIQENLIFLHNNPQSNKRALANRDIYQALFSYIFSNDYVQYISLIDENIEITMGSPLMKKNINLDELSQKAAINNGKILWTFEDQPSSSIYCIRSIRQRKYLNLKNLATLYIKVDLDAIINAALEKSGYPPTSTDFLLYSEDMLVYPLTKTYSSQFSEALNTASPYLIQSVGDDKKFIIHGRLNITPLDYVYFRDYNQLFHHLTVTKYYSFGIILLFSIIVLLITNLILKSTFKHLDYLLIKIKDFGYGLSPAKQQTSVYASRDDEIGKLHRHFDDMTRSVRVLRDSNYEKKIHLKDATIKMLEQQINPHFLYNTLDMINWMAQVEGAEDISNVALSLGKLFRASITVDKDLIPLHQELTFLNSYLQIQKIRFNERLSFTSSISDEYLHILIPKLSLQPLVENALKHAMEEMLGTCYIELCVTQNTENYIIELSNTGSAFEDDLLNRIKSNDLKPLGTGVGLINIDSRLRLLFGEEYGLQLYNQDAKAKVQMLIPKSSSTHSTQYTTSI